MDFATRNLYRNAIEELARGSPLTELEIAQRVLATAAAATRGRERDPGYYLIAEGRRELERAIGYRAPLRDWPGRIAFTRGRRRLRRRDRFHHRADAVAAARDAAARRRAAARCCGCSACSARFPPWTSPWRWSIARSTRGVGASRLPGLALREGVPAELRTLVAMPVMLTSRAAVEEHLHRLEIHYLASPDEQLHFALLSDWVDADTEHTASDDALLDIAVLGIARLNRRYGPAAGGERFLLLHRRRVWSESEQRWMGWERKRGKLQELNRLLRGATDTTYITSTGQLALGARRRALRDHARCRHARAARGAAPADRQDGAPAQSPALRCASSAAWSRATPSCSRASPSRCP